MVWWFWMTLSPLVCLNWSNCSSHFFRTGFHPFLLTPSFHEGFDLFAVDRFLLLNVTFLLKKEYRIARCSEVKIHYLIGTFSKRRTQHWPNCWLLVNPTWLENLPFKAVNFPRYQPPWLVGGLPSQLYLMRKGRVNPWQNPAIIPIIIPLNH